MIASAFGEEQPSQTQRRMSGLEEVRHLQKMAIPVSFALFGRCS